jgi:hypothetical protein
LALRATVLRLAVSQLRAADIGGGRHVSAGTLRPVLGVRAVPLRPPSLATRDAQPFHREDVTRAAPLRRLSCQTLGGLNKT